MPNSVLWVFLIVVWLFVLVPMVLRGRPAARTSTKAAAQTRVVHRGGSRSAASRRAAAQARSERAANTAKRLADRRATEAEAAEAVADDVNTDESIDDGSVVDVETVEPELAESDVEVTESEIVEIDAEIVEDDETRSAPATLRADAESPAEVTDVLDIVDVEVVDLDEAQAAHVDPLVSDEEADELDGEFDDGEFDDEYGEYDELDEDDGEEDSDETFEVLEAESEAIGDETDVEEESSVPEPIPRELRGRGGLAPGHVQEREEATYRERRRILAALSLLTVAAVVSAFFVQPLGYVAVGVMVVVFAAYLTFLRRAVRVEQERHAQRAARQRRRQAEDARIRREQAEPLYVSPPARLRRPGGAIVLEIDDEDPAFDHLPTYDFGEAHRYDSDFDGATGFGDSAHRAAV
ncbi:divisome protein SepX/GlpR [Gordonia sp. MP11Mi]|uniref:Transmembrane protein n=1 Tax=Gordonia sp. MP11Mi TaxID=3022769 RepID=A0AA97CSC4_9ACTN